MGLKLAMPHVTVGINPENPSAVSGAVDLYFELLDSTKDEFQADPDDPNPPTRRRPRGWYGNNDNFMLWQEYASYVKSTLSRIFGTSDKNQLKLKIYELYRANENDSVVQDLAQYFKQLDNLVKGTQQAPEAAPEPPPAQKAPAVAFWVRGQCRFAQCPGN